MSFKDSDNKFSGDIGEWWVYYVDEYAKVSPMAYGLNENQKKQYLRNLLTKDAKTLLYLKGNGAPFCHISTSFAFHERAIQLICQAYYSQEPP